MRNALPWRMSEEERATSNQQPATSDLVLAVDPGRDKCGLAVVARDGAIVERRVALVAQAQNIVLDWARAHQISAVVLGDSTTSREWQARLAAWLPETQILFADERGSTLEARTLYWQHHPPRGWRRLVPLSLQTPPEPIDDYAAVVLARRFFEGVKR